jgi:hypothetical protein
MNDAWLAECHSTSDRCRVLWKYPQNSPEHTTECLKFPKFPGGDPTWARMCPGNFQVLDTPLDKFCVVIGFQ